MTSRTHPWLTDPTANAPMPQAQLARRIAQFLTTTNMAVLATIGKDGPVASPIEYYADGLTLYMLADSGSPKLRNVERDPRVSLAVTAPNYGWVSVRGAQLFGRAEIIRPDDPRHADAMTIYRWQGSSAELGRDLAHPPRLPILRLAPDRVVYIVMWLKAEGYAAK
ncbi:MAG: pyridoxamine 5'-phosphate oxidase family protein, partial [Dehalococcoidia bacterium]|nr:pyridoxamine 5'-phosphate oxidase family protein [Dehalococcoidia bacterium]